LIPIIIYFDSKLIYFDECQIGKACLDNGLLKYSAKDHFFKALVCYFCLDRQIVEVNLPQNVHNWCIVEQERRIQSIASCIWWHKGTEANRGITLCCLLHTNSEICQDLYEAVQDEDTDKFSEHVSKLLYNSWIFAC
jgi:hypothetical protein